ncbi:MAG: tetratricopeptide repeat protein [Acidobacteriota bacterium]|nr:tetratricopeptide repeat protein [Acidobacteriota bacterium]
MKVFLTIVFLSALAVFQAGCSGVSSNSNADLTTNTNAATPAVENSPAAEAAVTENKQPEVVPTFTDAGEALASGNKYLDENKTENAIEALKQAVKLNPDLADAHFQLGIAYSLKEKEDELLQRDTEEATATPTPAPKRAKKGSSTKETATILTNSDKAFENAAKAYEKIIKKEPKNDAAFFNLGRAYNKINLDREAEKALRQAVKLKPEDGEYQTELGKILIKLANYDEAVIVLKKAVELDETNTQAIDSLEKAEAGKKRTNFGIKPKIPEDVLQKQEQQTRENNRGGRKTAKPKTEETKPSEQSPPPPPAKPNS